MPWMRGPRCCTRTSRPESSCTASATLCCFCRYRRHHSDPQSPRSNHPVSQALIHYPPMPALPIYPLAIRLSIHLSPAYPFTTCLLPIHPLSIHPFICPFTTHPLASHLLTIHPSIHPPITHMLTMHSFIHPSIHTSSTHMLIIHPPSINPPTHPAIHSSIHPYITPSIITNPPTHLFIAHLLTHHPSVHYQHSYTHYPSTHHLPTRSLLILPPI